MIEVKSLGEFTVVVSDLEAATRFYQNLFGLKELIAFKDFENAPFCANMGVSPGPVDIRLLKFDHCNLTLQLIAFSKPESAEVCEHKLGTVGFSSITLQVEDVLKTFEAVKEREDLKILGGEDFFPQALGTIPSSAFTLGEAEDQLDQKERVAKNLSEKHFFYFVDPYKVTWKIEERLFDTSF